jgi:hypothetical protein
MRELKEKIDEGTNILMGRVVRTMDNLVHRTDSLFTANVISYLLLSKFRLPQLEKFNGTRNPLDHLKTYKIIMYLQ